MSPEAVESNERILAKIEGYGGGYVWESEVFAVTLIGVSVKDAEASCLVGLTGVQQIAINASRLSFDVIQSLARISGLRSIVLSDVELSAEQIELLESCGPAVELVDDEA